MHEAFFVGSVRKVENVGEVRDCSVKNLFWRAVVRNVLIPVKWFQILRSFKVWNFQCHSYSQVLLFRVNYAWLLDFILKIWDKFGELKSTFCQCTYGKKDWRQKYISCELFYVPKRFSFGLEFFVTLWVFQLVSTIFYIVHDLYCLLFNSDEFRFWRVGWLDRAGLKIWVLFFSKSRFKIWAHNVPRIELKVPAEWCIVAKLASPSFGVHFRPKLSSQTFPKTRCQDIGSFKGLFSMVFILNLH